LSYCTKKYPATKNEETFLSVALPIELPAVQIHTNKWPGGTRTRNLRVNVVPSAFAEFSGRDDEIEETVIPDVFVLNYRLIAQPAALPRGSPG
jgi:hypothetical protein